MDNRGDDNLHYEFNISGAHLMGYGQITQVYNFGGVDVFDPLTGIRYPVDLERSDVREFSLGNLVCFSLIGETPDATITSFVRLNEAPNEVRRALSELRCR